MTGPDDVEWSVEANACLSTRRQMHVLWPDGEPLTAKCCNVHVFFEVEWRSMRAEYCLRESRKPDRRQYHVKLADVDCGSYFKRASQRQRRHC